MNNNNPILILNPNSKKEIKQTSSQIKSWKLICWAPPQRESTLQKLEYAAYCGAHTVFFSKRRKNSSLCAHHAAAWVRCLQLQLNKTCDSWLIPSRLGGVGLNIISSPGLCTCAPLCKCPPALAEGHSIVALLGRPWGLIRFIFLRG